MYNRSTPITSKVRLLASASIATTLLTLACTAPGTIRLRGALAPQGTVRVQLANGTVSVSWGAVAGATGYVVEAGLSPGATNAGAFQISGTSIASLAPPGRYYVRIRARNGCGVGPASSEIVIDVP